MWLPPCCVTKISLLLHIAELRNSIQWSDIPVLNTYKQNMLNLKCNYCVVLQEFQATLLSKCFSLGTVYTIATMYLKHFRICMWQQPCLVFCKLSLVLTMYMISSLLLYEATSSMQVFLSNLGNLLFLNVLHCIAT